MKLILISVFLLQSMAWTAFASTNREKFHQLLADKYELPRSEMQVVSLEASPERSQVLTLANEKKAELELFARSIQGPFSYSIDDAEFWQLESRGESFAYTFSIKIFNGQQNTFDYFCLAVLSQVGDGAATLGCAAYEVEAL